MGTFSGVSGAGFSPAQTISPMPSAASRARASACSGWASASSAPSASSIPARTAPRRPAATSSAAPGSRVRLPRAPGVSERRRVGGEVEQHRRQVDAGDAVDQRVVGLRDQREAVVLQSLDQPHLPQRLGAVELLGEDPRGQAPQLLPVARRGQRGVADVVLEVEVRVVDPHRAPAVQRGVGELVAVARDQVQPPADLFEEVLHRRRWAFDDRQSADVHVRVGSLLVQEGGVDRGEPVEVALCHRALSGIAEAIYNSRLSHGRMSNTVEKLLLAAPRGYCAGVDRAVQTVERALEIHGAPVYVRKEIVHNKHVVERLRERGAIFVERGDRSAGGGGVRVLRARRRSQRVASARASASCARSTPPARS